MNFHLASRKVLSIHQSRNKPLIKRNSRVIGRLPTLPFFPRPWNELLPLRLYKLSILTDNDLMSKLQSAYRRFHSTKTALLRVSINDILLALASRQEVVLVLLDLSSAFDTIDHDVLVDKLRSRYGIKGTALNWFRSYLTNRTQSVRIGDSSSSNRTLKYGVPQGSLLGPLLFSLFFCT